MSAAKTSASTPYNGRHYATKQVRPVFVEEPNEIVVVTVYVYYFYRCDMRITYDQNVDALYIRFKETTVTTKHLGEGIAADYDADGRLAGIEVLDAVKRLGDPNAFKRITLEDVAIAH
jgi:uncharacterized protein YuzE